MIDFFKRSTIHLNAFTWRRDVIEYAPVINAIEVIPDWWKNLPKQTLSNDGFSPMATMKTCLGMYDYYSKSVALPLWSDLCVNVKDKNYNWQFSDGVSRAFAHPSQQYAGYRAAERYGHLKIESPWLFSVDQNVDWLITAPVYNSAEFGDYVLAQGLLNFSRHNDTNLQLFIDLKDNRTFFIPAKSVFMLTPLSDKKVVINRHLITREQYHSKLDLARATTFINKHKAHEKATKCPYTDNIK